LSWSHQICTTIVAWPPRLVLVCVFAAVFLFSCGVVYGECFLSLHDFRPLLSPVFADMDVAVFVLGLTLFSRLFPIAGHLFFVVKGVMPFFSGDELARKNPRRPSLSFPRVGGRCSILCCVRVRVPVLCLCFYALVGELMRLFRGCWRPFPFFLRECGPPLVPNLFFRLAPDSFITSLVKNRLGGPRY